MGENEPKKGEHYMQQQKQHRQQQQHSMQKREISYKKSERMRTPVNIFFVSEIASER